MNNLVQILYQRSRTFFLLFSTVFLLGVSNLANATHACIKTTDGSTQVCKTLFAGQTIDAGQVCVVVNGENLDVTYTTANGWELVETHLWVGKSLTEMPQTRKGSPIPGQFPYKSGDITGQTSYTSSIPIDSLNFTCPSPDTPFFVAAHAALQKPDGNGGYQTDRTYEKLLL